jgi:hypothetical protein
MALAPSKNAVEMLVSEVVPTAGGLRRPIEQRLGPIVSGVRIAILLFVGARSRYRAP